MTFSSKIRSFLLAFALAAFLAVLPFAALEAQAAEAQKIATHGVFDVYSFRDQGQKVCYLFARPQKQQGNFKRRGDTYIQITHRPAENSYDVISVIAGYTYKPGSDVTIGVDGKNYTLFTDRDSAWARDTATDRALAKAMRAGNRLVIKGTSNRGTSTTDTYSLKGSADAWRALNEACGVKARKP